MIQARPGFLDVHKNMYAGYGVCALWFLGSMIYTLESEYLLSKLQSKLLDATITSVFAHWEGSIDVMVLLTTADYHYIVRKYTKTTVDVFQVFLCYTIQLFVPLLFAFTIIKMSSSSGEETGCCYLEGLFFMRSLYPISSCSWSVTIFHSNLFFGILAVTLINLMHKLFQINIARFVCLLYALYIIVHFIFISLKLIWVQEQYEGAYHNQSPLNYFFNYLHGILEIEMGVGYIQRKTIQGIRHPADCGANFLIRSIGDISFICIWCTIFLGLIPLNIITENYQVNKYLKIVIALFGRSAVVFFNQLFMHLLLYDKTLFFKHVYSNQFLIEIGENTSSIVLSYAINSHLYYGRISNIQLGPNNVGILVLYLVGHGFIILSFAHIFSIAAKELTYYAIKFANSIFQHFLEKNALVESEF